MADRLMAKVYLDYVAARSGTVGSILALMRRWSIVDHNEVPRFIEGERAGPTDDALSKAVAGHFLTGATDGPFARLTAIASLKFASSGTIVILDADEYLVRPVGPEWQWANSITIASAPGTTESWEDDYASMFGELCNTLRAVHGFATTAQEWDDRYLIRSAHAVDTIGLDSMADPPETGWLTYLGSRAASHILESGPITVRNATVANRPGGLLIRIAGRATDWQARRTDVRELSMSLCGRRDDEAGPCTLGRLLGLRQEGLPGRLDLP